MEIFCCGGAPTPTEFRRLRQRPHLPYAYGDSNIHADTNSDGDGHANGNGDCDGDRYCDSNCYRTAAAYTDAATPADTATSSVSVGYFIIWIARQPPELPVGAGKSPQPDLFNACSS